MSETSDSATEAQSFEDFVLDNEPMGGTATVQEAERSSADLERVTAHFMGPTMVWADRSEDVAVKYARIGTDGRLAIGLADERDD
jgi:hypothetical protein